MERWWDGGGTVVEWWYGWCCGHWAVMQRCGGVNGGKIDGPPGTKWIVVVKHDFFIVANNLASIDQKY